MVHACVPPDFLNVFRDYAYILTGWADFANWRSRASHTLLKLRLPNCLGVSALGHESRSVSLSCVCFMCSHTLCIWYGDSPRNVVVITSVSSCVISFVQLLTDICGTHLSCLVSPCHLYLSLLFYFIFFASSLLVDIFL